MKDKNVKDKVREVLEHHVEISEQGFEKFFQLYSSMPYYSETMEVRPDNVLFVYVVSFLAKIQYSKEGTYGNSWAKRKEIGVFMNLARKFDRLENMIIDGSQDEVGEGRIDTVGDTANYGILWMVYLLQHMPEEFINWTKEF